MNVFSFVKSRISIIDVISEYTTLKKAGLYLKGICPFHHEKTASFTVSPHKDIFYCFGCHSGGDVIAFIEKSEQCTALEAAQYLAERYNIQIPDEIQHALVPTDHKNIRDRYFKLCELFAKWCQQQLTKNQNARNYIQKRGVEDKIVDFFKLGFFPNSMTSIKQLLNFMKEHNFLLDDLIEFNFIIDAKNVLYSPFADRIIFPIKNHLGNFCGFGGRIYKSEDERPKYYNSRENPYFNKGSLLFGLDLAKKSIQQSRTAMLVEGYMDCLALVQQGYNNTVATLGTACNLDQLQLLARYAQELIVVYDGDDAGQKAMLRLTELCWQVNLELKIMQLPPNTDPASLFESNRNFQLKPEQSKDIFVFFVDQIAKNFIGLKMADKIDTIRSLISLIKKLDDPLKQDLLLQRAAQTFDIPFASLTNELSRFPKDTKKEYREIPRELAPSANLKEISLLEKKLFSVIINNINRLSEENKQYLFEYLSLPLQDLFKKLVAFEKKTSSTDFMYFFDELTIQEKQMVSQLIAQTYDYQNAEQLEFLLIQFQRKNWKSFVSNTKIKLTRAQQSGNREEEKKILNQFQELKKKLIAKGLI